MAELERRCWRSNSTSSVSGRNQLISGTSKKYTDTYGSTKGSQGGGSGGGSGSLNSSRHLFDSRFASSDAYDNSDEFISQSTISASATTSTGRGDTKDGFVTAGGESRTVLELIEALTTSGAMKL
jgi:hypothetical protein